MHYRREIDGLRAVAVLPVIFFHAGFKAFSGGYVGVDVFFVISGYLITSIIVEEKEAGTFSLAQFYERRARRILPALILVALACVPFALLWLLPSDLKDFSASLIAVSTFWSNILFWMQSGYFDAAAELKPLLHTWSLAVEEQYYVLFPLLVLATWRFGKYWMLAILTCAAVVSLAAAQWGSQHEPVRTFFLLQTRAWELAIGAFTAIYLLHYDASRITSPIASQALSLAGLAMVIAAVFGFDQETPFPSLYALLPTVGTALIVIFATPETTAGKILGNGALVSIGLISYSAYLWHQPLFAFARYRYLGEPHWPLFFCLSLLAFLLAYLSWRFVERPFRARGLFARKQIFAFALTGMASVLLMGLFIYANNGFTGRVPANIEWRNLGEKLKTVGWVCEMQNSYTYRGVEFCIFGDQGASKAVALYGDSHAQALQYQLDTQFKHEHIKGVFVRAHECNVIPHVFNAKNTSIAGDCLAAYDNLLRFVKAQVDDVIIVGRWTFRLYPIKGEIEDLAFDNREGGHEFESYREFSALDEHGAFAQTAEAKASAVRHLLDTMTGTGKPIILVYPIPELGWDIAKVNFFRGPLDSLTTSYPLYQARNRFVLNLFDAYQTPNLVKIRPAEIFCSQATGRCSAQEHFVPLYYDDDHLSDVGAKLLVDKIMERLN